MNDKINFAKYSSYYDLINKKKDYSSEVEYVDTLLIKNRIPGKNLLEFGSGTGKHGCLLSEKGYEILGVEKSLQMLKLAKESNSFKSILGDVRTIDLNKKFDGVLSLFHVVSYQIYNHDVISLFNNAAKHLNSGGLFIFDVWYTPAVNFLKPSIRIRKIKERDIEIIRIAEPEIFHNQSRVDVNYTFFYKETSNEKFEKFSEKHQMRHFSNNEINLFAEISGFECISSESFLTAAPLSEKTWGACFVLRKV